MRKKAAALLLMCMMSFMVSCGSADTQQGDSQYAPDVSADTASTSIDPGNNADLPSSANATVRNTDLDVPNHKPIGAWKENNLGLDIYTADAFDDMLIHIEYLDYTNVPVDRWWMYETIEEMHGKDEGIDLLVINGGFVPRPQMIGEHDDPYVPLHILAYIGINIDREELVVSIPVLEHMGEFYYSLVSAAESKGYTASFYASFNAVSNPLYEHSRAFRDTVGVWVLEQPIANDQAELKTIDEGLTYTKALSEAEYSVILEQYADEGIPNDYDPSQIVYTGKTFGRYYIFQLEGFDPTLFYNRYTGELYSECYGLPAISINKGFSNLSWGLYQ